MRRGSQTGKQRRGRVCRMRKQCRDREVIQADEAAVGVMRRLEHSQKEIVLKERGKLLAWNTVRKR